jgi:hypothetical protein
MANNSTYGTSTASLPAGDSIIIDGSDSETGVVHIEEFGATGSVDVYREVDTDNTGSYDVSSVVETETDSLFSTDNDIRVAEHDSSRIRILNTDSTPITVWAIGFETPPTLTRNTGIESSNIVASATPQTTRVESGATLDVDVELLNNGNSFGDSVVELVATDRFGNDIVLDDDTVSLYNGEHTSLTLSYTPTDSDVGLYDVFVRTDDTTSTESSVRFLQSDAVFYVQIDSVATNTPVEGDTVDVDVVVENIGGSDGSKDVSLFVGGSAVDTVSSVSVQTGNSKTVTLSYTTQDVGTQSLVASTEDASDHVSIDVVDGVSSFELSITSVSPQPIENGDTVTIDVDVSNVGNSNGTQDIQLFVDGVLEDTVSGVSVDARTTVSETLSYTTSETGTDKIVVASEDGMVVQTETVNSGSGGGGSSDLSDAQQLALTGHSARTIESESGVSASDAQMLYIMENNNNGS